MMHPIRNPRTGEFDTQIEFTDAAQIAGICQNLRQHQLSWRALPLEERINALQAFKQALLPLRDELIEQLSHDTGRYTESVIEFDALIGCIDKWSRLAPIELADPEPKQANISYVKISGQGVPYPLLGVISPWNFPLLLSLIDAVPALAAGCSVIIKPSEVTPRFTQTLTKAVNATPYIKDVMSIVIGDGQTGAELVNNVDIVCFTGSVATGRKVATNAASNLIPAFLELGGKDAAVVFDDVDLERTASSLIWGSMANAGQVCLSVERVYIQDTIYNELAQLLADKARALTFCQGENWKQGHIGPVIAASQAAVIQGQLQDAADKGATFLCGGKILDTDGGLWCEPTIIANANHQMKIAVEETFGPILALVPFKDEAEAVQLANDTEYGLSGAVFSNDIERAYRVAAQLEAGGISINDCSLTGMIHDGEKHSFKSSGLGGSRMGPSSIKRFLRKKAILHNVDQTWNSWWF